MNQWIRRQTDRLTEIFRLWEQKKLMKESTKYKTTRSEPKFKSALFWSGWKSGFSWLCLSISPTLCLVSLHYRCCGCWSEPVPPSWSLISAWAEGSQPRRERFASLRQPPSVSCQILRSSCICTELLKITNQSSIEGQDDQYKALEEPSTTRGSSSLPYLHKSIQKTSKHDYEIVHFFKPTQKTRSKKLKLKLRESLTGSDSQRLLVFCKEDQRRTRQHYPPDWLDHLVNGHVQQLHNHPVWPSHTN